MTARPFPQEWLTPTPEAHRAAAAISEGFCPFAHCGYPFDEGSFCPLCEVTWSLVPGGFSGSVTGPPRLARVAAVYPFTP